MLKVNKNIELNLNSIPQLYHNYKPEDRIRKVTAAPQKPEFLIVIKDTPMKSTA